MLRKAISWCDSYLRQGYFRAELKVSRWCNGFPLESHTYVERGCPVATEYHETRVARKSLRCCWHNLEAHRLKASFPSITEPDHQVKRQSR